MSNNNNTKTPAKLWQKLPIQDVVFSDQKPGDSSIVSSSNLSKSIKSIEKSLASIQSELREVKQQNALLVDQLQLLRTSMNKIISNALIDKHDWDKIRKAIRLAWTNNKFLTSQEITQIIAEAMAMDDENEENQQFFKLALDKAKDYLRCTLYKTFVDNVFSAVEDYFVDNLQVEEDDIPDHVDRIIRIGRWTKTNPTAADKRLASKLIKELIEERLENQLHERPKKKPKTERTYPRNSFNSDEVASMEQDNEEHEAQLESAKS